MSRDWTKEEVILIVADYFEMLNFELSHKSYKKSEQKKISHRLIVGVKKILYRTVV